MHICALRSSYLVQEERNMKDFRLRTPVVGLTVAMLISATVSAQEKDESPAETKPSFVTPGWSPMVGGSVIAVVSPKNDYVLAYSKHTGIWQKQELETRPEKAIQTTVNAQLVVFEADRKVYAFGASKGRWEAVEVERSKDPVVYSYTDMVVVQTENQVHVFSDETANWASVTIESNE